MTCEDDDKVTDIKTLDGKYVRLSSFPKSLHLEAVFPRSSILLIIGFVSWNLNSSILYCFLFLIFRIYTLEFFFVQVRSIAIRS